MLTGSRTVARDSGPILIIATQKPSIAWLMCYNVLLTMEQTDPRNK